MANYLRGVWYMAAWSNEVDAGLFSRKICGKRIVLLRKEDGAVAALEDRCAHRFAPLSMGERTGDEIICPYHGLRYNASGVCVGNPFSDRIPARAKVASFPVVERDSILWLWMGAPEAADSALIPDFSMMKDDTTCRTVRGQMPLAAPFEYGIDNLMDLSHIEFAHKGTFAGQGVIFAGKHEVVQEGMSLRSNWWMPDIPRPGMAQGVYPENMPSDHWLDMHWNAPASMHLEIGVTPTGCPREEGHIAHQAHILTPEDDENSHYFWASTRTNDVASTEADQFLFQLFDRAFRDEDKPLIEAAYDNVRGKDFWSQKPVSLGIDTGGTRARRILEGMHQQALDDHIGGLRRYPG